MRNYKNHSSRHGYGGTDPALFGWEDVAAAETLFMASSYDQSLFTYTGSLFTLDMTTGELTLVGPIGYGVTGIDIHPSTGVMYGVTSKQSVTHPCSLVTIDPATGAGTLVGSWGGTAPIPDISFDSAGVLYGVHHLASSNDVLVTIDLATGALTTVGTIGITGGTSGLGLAFDPVTGVLYFMPKGGVGQSIYTLNKTTGAPTVIGTVTGSGTNFNTSSMAFRPSDNELFFVSNAGSNARYLSTLDTSTLAAVMEFAGANLTYLGSINTYIDGMVWRG